MKLEALLKSSNNRTKDTLELQINEVLKSKYLMQCKETGLHSQGFHPQGGNQFLPDTCIPDVHLMEQASCLSMLYMDA
jgi:hypothetical protein